MVKKTNNQYKNMLLTHAILRSGIKNLIFENSFSQVLI